MKTLEENIYTYKNNKYKLKPLTIAVLSSAAPMLAAFRKLVHKYTADIDMSDIKISKERIGELETAIQQVKEIEPDNNTRIEELNDSLNKAKADFENNQLYRSTLRLYNECSGLALLELMGDGKLISGFVENVLCAADGTKTPVKLDHNSSETTEFVKDVVTDFFGCIAGKQKEFTG